MEVGMESSNLNPHVYFFQSSKHKTYGVGFAFSLVGVTMEQKKQILKLYFSKWPELGNRIGYRTSKD